MDIGIGSLYMPLKLSGFLTTFYFKLRHWAFYIENEQMNWHLKTKKHKKAQNQNYKFDCKPKKCLTLFVLNN